MCLRMILHILYIFAPYVGGQKKMLSVVVTPLDKNINTDYKCSLPKLRDQKKIHEETIINVVIKHIRFCCNKSKNIYTN